jgi:hypothetical protein
MAVTHSRKSAKGMVPFPRVLLCGRKPAAGAPPLVHIVNLKFTMHTLHRLELSTGSVVASALAISAISPTAPRCENPI